MTTKESLKDTVVLCAIVVVVWVLSGIAFDLTAARQDIPTPQIDSAPLRQRVQTLEAEVEELRGWMEKGVVIPAEERVDSNQ